MNTTTQKKYEKRKGTTSKLRDALQKAKNDRNQESIPYHENRLKSSIQKEEDLAKLINNMNMNMPKGCSGSNEDCKDNEVRNPTTGRCIKVDGNTYKKLYPNGHDVAESSKIRAKSRTASSASAAASSRAKSRTASSASASVSSRAKSRTASSASAASSRAKEVERSPSMERFKGKSPMAFTDLPGDGISIVADNLNKQDVGNMALAGIPISHVNPKKFSKMKIVPRKTAVVHLYPYLQHYLDYHTGAFDKPTEYLQKNMEYTAEFGLNRALSKNSQPESDEQTRIDSEKHLDTILTKAYPGDLIYAEVGSNYYPDGYHPVYMVSAFNTHKDVANELMSNKPPLIYPSLSTLLKKSPCGDHGCGDRFVYKLKRKHDGSEYITNNDTFHILSYQYMDNIEDLIGYFYPNFTNQKVLYSPKSTDYIKKDLKKFFVQNFCEFYDRGIVNLQVLHDEEYYVPAIPTNHKSQVSLNLMLSRRSRFLQKFANQLMNEGEHKKDWVRFFGKEIELVKVINIKLNEGVIEHGLDEHEKKYAL